MTLLIFCLLAGWTSKIQFEADLKSRFLPDDPALAALQKERDLFGSSENLFLLIESDSPLSLTEIKPLLTRWKSELTQFAGVEKVYSLFDLPYFQWKSPKEIQIITVGEFWDSKKESEILEERFLLLNPLIRKNFLRKDARGTLLILNLSPQTKNTVFAKKLIEQVEGWMRRQKVPYRLTLAGALAFQSRAIQSAYLDVFKITGLLVVILFGLLYFFFRSGAAVLLTLGVGLLNGLAALGTAALVQWKMSQFILIALPVILTISLLDNLHVLYIYSSKRDFGRSPQEAWRAIFHEVFIPCFWTSLTTVAGFLALTFTSVPQIRHFGLLTALGIGLALISSFTLLPFLLKIADPKTAPEFSRKMEGVLLRFSPKKVVWISFILIGVSVFGLFRLKFKPDFPDLFSSNHPITLEARRIEKDWGGMATVSYLLRLKEPYSFFDRPIVERLNDFTSLLQDRDLTSSVTSPLDFLSSAHSSFSATFGRPPDPQELEGLLNSVLKDQKKDGFSEELKQWGNLKERTLRVTARLKMMQPKDFPALARDLAGFRNNLSDLFEVELTGWPLLFKNLEQRLLKEFMISFVFSLLAVAGLLVLALRSWRWSILAFIPNFLPILMVLGLVGLVGEGINYGLAIALDISLGLVVDDTLHLVLRLKEEEKKGLPWEEAFRRSLQAAGMPVSINSIVLAAGFGSLLFSSFRSNQSLAWMMEVLILVALLAEFFLLPVCLRIAAAPAAGFPQSGRKINERRPKNIGFVRGG